MRRRELTEHELQNVIQHKQQRCSWLKIEKETGIPRRAAKRAYELWEQSQPLAMLNEVRKEVAAQEFRQHLEDLAGFSQFLTDRLPTSQDFAESRESEAVLEQILESDFRQPSPTFPTSIEKRRTKRQNGMLLKSLQAHTSGRVQWRSLQDWRRTWDERLRTLRSIRVRIEQIVGQHMNKTRNLEARLKAASGREDIIERVVTGLLSAVASPQQQGDIPDEAGVCKLVPGISNRLDMEFGDQNYVPGIVLSEPHLAHQLKSICDSVAQNMWHDELARKAADQLVTIRTSVQKLEEALDPLVLRPIILKSRCDICPV